MSKIDQLKEVKAECFACTKCPLHKGDKKVSSPHVFGRGNVNAKVMVVGQNPGFNETVQKKPFIGAAGKNFDAFLAEIGMSRKDFYITNTVKCYSPGNRAPKSNEIAACKSILQREIEIVKPKLILVLGNYALQYFIKETGITSKHGMVIKSLEFDIPVFVMYHPSPMNMNKSAIKQEARADFERLKAHLETI